MFIYQRVLADSSRKISGYHGDMIQWWDIMVHNTSISAWMGRYFMVKIGISWGQNWEDKKINTDKRVWCHFFRGEAEIIWKVIRSLLVCQAVPPKIRQHVGPAPIIVLKRAMINSNDILCLSEVSECSLGCTAFDDVWCCNCQCFFTEWSLHVLQWLGMTCVRPLGWPYPISIHICTSIFGLMLRLVSP